MRGERRRVGHGERGQWAVRNAPPVYIEEPRFSKWLFGSSAAAWIWLVARLWLGWEWLQAGWSKVFGGDITWKVWDWGNSAYGLTGDGNIGWVRSGTVVAEDGQQPDPPGRRRRGRVRQRRPGARHRRRPPGHRLLLVRDLAGVAARQRARSSVPWSRSARSSSASCLILGLFTGIMAFLGAS